MLHRSFKPAKCKTSLKLATSRLKLMKNKKEVQVKHLKRDLALLLESGQEQTARIRVEHVVREEKMMAAYELLEIYCELIVARLPIIESQKNCPIDLKEAITSVIFASPRCSDITELLDIRKHFTAKYGKEFITAAIELRPECGVNRTLVEKLSAVATDGQTKIKIMTAIAEEHNIKWDPNSFGEKDSKPPDDLLNGPNNFKKASEMHAETPNAQAPNVQAPPRHDQRDDPPINSFVQNSISSPSFQSFASTDSVGTKPTMSTIHSPEIGPSGTEAERREIGQSFSENMNAFRPGRQNWNMEFKDATSAAQAAAESAERASMAARAAAELASRRDGGPGRYEHIAKDSVNSTSYGRNFKLPNEHIDENEQNNLVGPVEKFYQDSRGSTRRSNRSDSERSSKASIGDDSLETTPGKGYSRRNLSEEKAVNANEGVLFAESMKKQSGESEVEIVRDHQDGFKSQNFNYYVEERITKSSSMVSSHSHSSTLSGDYNVPNSTGQKFGNDAGEDPFAGVNQGNIHRETMQTSSPDHDTIVFDEHGSDNDDYKFDIEPKYDEEEAKLYFPSPGRESPDPPSPHADSWNPKEDIIGSLEKSSSQPQISTDRPPSPEFSESLSKSAEPSESDNKFPISFDQSDGPTSESEDELSSESGNEFKFGTLTGGFRNKGYTHPPYTKKVAEDTFSTIEQPTASIPVKGSSSSRESTKVNSISSSKAPTKHNDSDADSESDSDSDSEEEFPHKTLSSKQEPHNRIARKEVNTKSKLRVPVTYFDDDEDDSKEDVEKQTFNSKGRVGSGFSRRTKVTPSSSDKSSYSRVTTGSKESGSYNSGSERIFSRTSYGTETPGQMGSSEQSKSNKPAASKPLLKAKISSREENSKSSAVERPPSPPREPVTEASSRQNTVKKASHVHPKLPDFDTIAAQLQPRRSDRQ